MTSNSDRRTGRPATTVRQASTRAELRRIEAAGSPWWNDIPAVAHACLAVALAPLHALAMLVDLLVSLAFLSLIGAVAAWWFGYIPDVLVAELAGEFGDRILSILERGGIL